MSRINRRVCHDAFEKKETQAIATPVHRKKLLMAKRIVLGIAVTVFAIVAIVFAIQFYRHMTGGDENQPGIIFERTDRPSRA
jgi:hypothetical protein